MTKRLLILSILALCVLALANFADAQSQFPTATPFVGFVSPTPFAAVITPTPAATPGCAAPLNLTVGGQAFVKGGVYVRYQPSASSPWVNYYTESVTVRIVGGPVCDNQRYNWWQVRGPGNDGWVAEGLPGGYWIQAGPSQEVVCPASVDLPIGGRAELLQSVRIRETTSESAITLTVAPNDAVADVLEGPVCAEGKNWWKVAVVVVNVRYVGWMSEGFPGEPFVQAEGADLVPVCAPPMRLEIGGQAYVNYTDGKPKNLRAAPGVNSELVATLLDGIGFEIIGGPVCADSYNWWQIRILSRPDVSGWLAEGGPPRYWITRLREFQPPSH